MKFFSKELSAKLQEIGCKCGGFYWQWDQIVNDPYNPFLSENKPAFCIADFLSDEPYALENCKKIKPEQYVCNHCGDDYKILGPKCGSRSERLGHEFSTSGSRWFRHHLLDAPDQEAFLWETLVGSFEHRVVHKFLKDYDENK